MWHGVNKSIGRKSNSRFVYNVHNYKITDDESIGTVGRPMPGVLIRIGRENPLAPTGYDTLVEADSDNTKLEVKSMSQTSIFFK